MNHKIKKFIEKVNNKLAEKNSSIKLISKCEKENKYLLSNQRKINMKFLRRIVFSEHYNVHLKELLSSDEKTANEKYEKLKKELKRKIASMAAITMHAKYREKGYEHRLGIEPWNKGKKGCQIAWSKGLTKHTDGRLKRISEERSGSGNPMFDKTHSTENKLKWSVDLKEKIHKGEFTPNVHNSLCHEKIKWKNNNFRSSWELIYFVFNQHLKYEKIRIKYFDQKEVIHSYIVDFVDEKQRKLIEIKPKAHINRCRHKINAAIKWCELNDYTFEIISEDYFKEKYQDIMSHREIPIIIKNKMKQFKPNENKKN